MDHGGVGICSLYMTTCWWHDFYQYNGRCFDLSLNIARGDLLQKEVIFNAF